AVSYALVESPCREALRRWEYHDRRAGAKRPGESDPGAGAKRPGESDGPPPLDSSVSDSPEPVAAR
ncbi:MAG TPA: hypothetical protein VI029_12600, partial [Mycobacterium sp.]